MTNQSFELAIEVECSKYRQTIVRKNLMKQIAIQHAWEALREGFGDVDGHQTTFWPAHTIQRVRIYPQPDEVTKETK